MAGIVHNQALYSPPRDVPQYDQRLAFEDEANAILHRRRFWEGMMQTSAGKGRPPIARETRMMSVANAQEVRGSARWSQSRRSRQACISFVGIDPRLLTAYGDSGRAARRAEKASKRAGHTLVIDASTFTPKRSDRRTKRSRVIAATTRDAMNQRARVAIGSIHTA